MGDVLDLEIAHDEEMGIVEDEAQGIGIKLLIIIAGY